VTSVVRQWDRRDWGPGGDEFHWWCTEDPEAFVGTRPVYEELGPELIALSGRKIYKRLVRYLQARAGRTTTNGTRPSSVTTAPTAVAPTPVPVPVPLPHPAVRRR
jgi:hypothetical protein